jgi:hypothetical protein
MIGGLRVHELVVTAAALGAGLTGTVVALGSRGADAQLLQDQRHPPSLQPNAVERVVRTAPDPMTGKGSADAATCTSRGSGQLRNPWSCVVRYRAGKALRMTVVVQQDGTYDGRFVSVKGAATTGCCIDLPGTQ